MIGAIEKSENVSDAEMDAYAIKLAEYLDEKEQMIRNVRSKFDVLVEKQAQWNKR